MAENHKETKDTRDTVRPAQRAGDGTVVLCAASAIQDQLHIICVLFTEDIGGIILFEFDKDGKLSIRTEAKASDYDYDEIGAALEVKEIQKQRRDMMNGLELYYKAVVLHQPLDLEAWQLE